VRARARPINISPPARAVDSSQAVMLFRPVGDNKHPARLARQRPDMTEFARRVILITCTGIGLPFGEAEEMNEWRSAVCDGVSS
jgi:hypothetical protein